MRARKMVMGRLMACALMVALALFASATPARAQYGRTEGGYAGTALGLMGGSALGAALAAAAGAGNPLLSGAIMATSALGGGFLGARLGSGVGNAVDHRFSAEQIWSVVGGVTGGLMGFVLMPGGGVVAKALGAAIGAAIGGWLGDHYARKANQDYNPRTIGALIGGVNGALLGGPFGAAIGIPLGYVGGDLFDKYVFVDPNSRIANWYPNGIGAPGSPTTTGGGIYDDAGYDREGYDRTGFNRAGYDREGYDRLGYNAGGVDRQGYNRAGFRVSQPAAPATTGPSATASGPASSAVSSSMTYNPDIYRGYWAAWSRDGGKYPELDHSHWQYFPPERQAFLEQQYTQRYQQHVHFDVQAYFPPGTSLSEKRAAWRGAISEFEKMLADDHAPADVKAAALQNIQQLQQQLNATMGGAN